MVNLFVSVIRLVQAVVAFDCSEIFGVSMGSFVVSTIVTTSYKKTAGFDKAMLEPKDKVSAKRPIVGNPFAPKDTSPFTPNDKSSKDYGLKKDASGKKDLDLTKLNAGASAAIQTINWS